MSLLFIKGPEGPLSERKGPRAPWYLRPLAKSAFFGPTLIVGHQMVPSTHTGRVRKSAIFGTTLTVGHQMVYYTGRVRKHAIFGKLWQWAKKWSLYRQSECNFWQNFDCGPPNSPLYSRQNFDFVPQNGPLYRQSGDKCNFGSTLTSWLIIQWTQIPGDWWKVQFLAPLCQWS